MWEGRLCQSRSLQATSIGLPLGQADNVIAAFADLVERACTLALSTGVTNNALALPEP